MWVLVTYDVNTETKQGQARLRKVAEMCESYGQRVQKSVFECDVNETQYERMKSRLLRIISQQRDSLRIYRLREPRETGVEEFGVGRVIDFRGPLVI
jgi:CRISPR-associated protein Cas2